MHTNSIHAAGPAGIASRAAETAHGVIDKVAGAAPPVVDRLASSAHATLDKAASAANRLEQRGEELVEASDKLLSSTRDFVRSKPLVVLGFGLAAGLLISRLIR
jgi:ElaB/YqjD/DUF883 family membrane-anchored ribosome-binding protein